MATFKAGVKSLRQDNFYKVYIRVTNLKKHAYLDTGMKIHKNKVDNGDITDHLVSGRCSRIITDYMNKLNLVDSADWDVKEIADFLTTGNEKISFTDYSQLYIDKLINEDRTNTAEGYISAIKSLKKQLGENFAFVDITTKKLQDWINSLRNTARAKESYPKAVKAIFDAGCLEYNDSTGLSVKIPNRPFDGVKIPKHDLPEQKAVEAEVIRRIIEYRSYSKRTEMAVDITKLIICLAGINTMDIFKMTKDNVKNGKLCYYRSKTKSVRRDKAYIEIAIRPEIKDLMTKYNNGDKLWDFGYRTAKDFNKYVNIGLKTVCKIVGAEPLGTYAFRHSWATIAQNDCGYSTEEIAFGLNHASAHKVTAGYIKKDFSKVDELTESVVNYVFRGDMNASVAKDEEMVNCLIEGLSDMNNMTMIQMNGIANELFGIYLDGFNKRKKYTFDSLPEVALSGTKYLAYLYLTCKIANPILLQKTGLSLDVEFDEAYKLFLNKNIRKIA